MADQVRVFVSHHHSTEDAFTARLVADLEVAGADVWVDDARITSDDFIKKINEGLTGRQWLVLVMTPDSLRSPWVQAEVNAALLQVRQGRMLGVIPFVAQPCNDADIPPLWATLQRYDATGDYQRAFVGLLRALGLSAPVRQPTHPIPSEAVQPTISPDRFPPRLASLGYQAQVVGEIEMILPPTCDVPAGEFLMGSDFKKDGGAQPQHRVALPDYAITRFPITVAEYACAVKAQVVGEPAGVGPSWRPTEPFPGQLDHLDGGVVDVSWHDAVAYAAWLASLTGQRWRLPSEAEWEKAARGTDGREYPWGNQSNIEFGYQYYHQEPVKDDPFFGGPYGVQEIVGHFEWTSTLDSEYPYNPSDGREDQTVMGQRVVRGGMYDGKLTSLRVARRYAYDPTDARPFLGFRLVLAPSLR
jgi:formylglycine-generating enzyme required for sulfatase activity